MEAQLQVASIFHCFKMQIKQKSQHSETEQETIWEHTGRNKPLRSPEKRAGIAAVPFSISLLQHNRSQQGLN